MEAREVALYSVSIFIILILIAYIGLGNFVLLLTTADYSFILLAILLQIAIIIVQVFRLLILLGGGVSFRGLFPIYLVSSTVTRFSPVGFVQEPLKAFLLKKYRSLAYKTTVVPIILERVFDYAVVGILLIISVFWLNIFLSNVYLIILSAAFIALFLICLVPSIFSRLLLLAIGFLKKLIKSKSLREMDERALAQMNVPGPSLSFAFAATALRWAFAILRTGAVILAFGQVVPIPVIMLIVSVTTIIQIAPILPGGAGIIEFVNTAIYTLFGLPFTIAFSISLFDRFVSLYLYIPLTLATGLPRRSY